MQHCELQPVGFEASTGGTVVNPTNRQAIKDFCRCQHSTIWKLLVKDFGRLFSLVAGAPTNVYKMRSRISERRFNLKRLDRQLATR